MNVHSVTWCHRESPCLFLLHGTIYRESPCIFYSLDLPWWRLGHYFIFCHCDVEIKLPKSNVARTIFICTVELILAFSHSYIVVLFARHESICSVIIVIFVVTLFIKLHSDYCYATAITELQLKRIILVFYVKCYDLKYPQVMMFTFVIFYLFKYDQNYVHYWYDKTNIASL